MVIRSLFPDVAVPEVPLTDFVLARAAELGDKPALIDAPSGRMLTYAELVESVRAVAAGLAERGFGKGDVFAHYAPNLPEYAVAFHAVATVGGVNTTVNPLLTAEELATQLNDCGARLLMTVPEFLEKASRGRRGSRRRGDFRLRRGRRRDAVCVAAGGGWRAARGHDRSGRGSGRAAVFERHHGAAQGRDAHPPQPGREHLPVHRSPNARRDGSSGRHRRAAVLSHLRARRAHEPTAVPRRDARDDAAVRPGGVPARGSGLPRSRGAWVVPPIVLALAKHPLVDEFDLSSLQFMHLAALRRCGRARGGLRHAAGLPDGAGLRPDRDQPVRTHSVPDDLAGQMPGSIGPPVPNTECRIVDAATGEDAPAGRARRAVHPRPAGDEGLPEQPGGHGADDHPRRLAAHRRRRPHRGERLLRIVDRIKELIKYKAYQIAPAELEALLLTHPAITDAAVDPSPRRGGRRGTQGVRGDQRVDHA